MAKAKLLFDECITPATVDDLRNLQLLQRYSYEVEHTNALEFGGQRDEVWVPKIARQGWVIVSGDRGSRPKAGTGAKLAEVCRAYRVTHVLLSATMAALKKHQKLSAIIYVWDELVELQDKPPGSGFQLQYLQGVPKLVPKGDPPPDSGS